MDTKDASSKFDLSSLGVPKAFRFADYSDWPNSTAVTPKGNQILIAGSTGTGKTHLAAAIFRDWLRQDLTKTGVSASGKNIYNDSLIEFVSVPYLLLRIRSTFDGKGASEMEVAEHYSKVKRGLVLDDLGAEKMTDWSISTLYVILSSRLDNLRHTVVTTNMDLRQIHEWEPRIASRLAGMEFIKLQGGDRRMRGE